MTARNTKLTPVAVAIEQLLPTLPRIDKSEQVPVLASQGRILASSVTAPMPVPPWDNSAMDGYAVRAQDVNEVPVTLEVAQRITAGEVGEPLEDDELIIVPAAVAQVDQGAAGRQEIPLVAGVRDDGAECPVRESPVAEAADGVGAADKQLTGVVCCHLVRARSAARGVSGQGEAGDEGEMSPGRGVGRHHR